MDNKDIYKKVLETIEGVVLFFALFDMYEISIIFMLISTTMLLLDLRYKFIEKEEMKKIFFHYWKFPIILIAFYILFGLYSKSNIKFIMLLGGYACLRVIHVYLKWRYDKDGVNKMRKMFKKYGKGRAV